MKYLLHPYTLNLVVRSSEKLIDWRVPVSFWWSLANGFRTFEKPEAEVLEA